MIGWSFDLKNELPLSKQVSLQNNES